MDDSTKTQFFGLYGPFPAKFEFSEEEKELIYVLSRNSKEINSKRFGEVQESEIAKKIDSTAHWFCNSTPENNIINAPKQSQNLLTKMMASAENNALRPKNGYRYEIGLKRLAVYNRMLAGPLGYKSLQLNLGGCFPSTSTTNRCIQQSNNGIVEGILRVDELKLYLEERNQPFWVALSEDATRIVNRVQYDIHTNQIVGFVLPLNVHTGMPIPFSFMENNIQEMLNHLKNEPTAHYIITVMAKSLGDAASFCLMVFGSDNKYKARDVANRWKFITSELEKVGVRVLTISSDSDPKYNSAMRQNSSLGMDSIEMSMGNLFKCGIRSNPPFYTQDFPHSGTKLRNFFFEDNC